MILTRVTTKNADAFAAFSPGGSLSEAELTGKSALGVLSGGPGNAVPAGLLIFEIRYMAESAGHAHPYAQLLWLFVSESMRGQGYGRALVQELFRLAEGAHLLGVRLVFSADAGAVSEQNRAFFSQIGFALSDSRRVRMRIPLKELASSKIMKAGEHDEEIRALDTLTPAQREAVEDRFAERADQFASDARSCVEAKVSAVILEDHTATGVCLVRWEKADDGEGYFDHLFLRALPKTSSRKILSLLHFTLGRALKLYGPETMVNIAAEYPPSVNLLEHLLEDCPVEKTMVGYWGQTP